MSKLGDVIDQTDRHRLVAAQLGCTDDLARFYPYLLVDGLNGSNEVSPESDLVVVTLVKGKPGDLNPTLSEPAGYQGGFSKACRRGDQGQFSV